MENTHYKKDLMLKIIEFNRNRISLKELVEFVLNTIKNLSIDLNVFFNRVENKNNRRGLFNNNLFAEYFLINDKDDNNIYKLFFDGNNIYLGIFYIQGNMYHRFLFNKAVRDNLSNINVISHFQMELIEKEEFNSLEDLDKKNFIKISYKSNQEYIKLLKQKLIEEGLEVLKAVHINDICEELGDVYMILQTIEEKTFLIEEKNK
jgi:hypothetical protein